MADDFDVLALLSEYETAEKTKDEIISNDGIEVMIYTPLGGSFLVFAKDQNHADFLLKANPMPSKESVDKLILEIQNEIILTCEDCKFFQRNKINPNQGLGKCKLDVNRNNKPIYPLQDSCEDGVKM